MGLLLKARKALDKFDVTMVKGSLELAPNAWFLGETERFYDNSYAVKNFKMIADGEVVEEPMRDNLGSPSR